jgi:hypothetical protein
VLDDYCPRERRITDHAIVAMIDDEIRRTRCGSCDAEHEYKEAKVPSPRRKTPPPALFTQVLDNINGPAPPHAATPAASDAIHAAAAANGVDAKPAPAMARVPPEAPLAAEPVEPVEPAFARQSSDELRRDKPVEPVEPADPADPAEPAEPQGELEGGFRRSLIRATFPRPEGQAPADRKMPEFTIQSLNNRRNGQRHAGGPNKFRGGRRRPGGGSQDNLGPMRFRDHGHGQGNGQGQGQGQGGRRRRGGKKNR